MSKSLGNFYTLRDLLDKGYSGTEVRYMLMHIHYRTPLNFTFEGLEGAKISFHRLNDFVFRMQEIADTHSEPSKHCRQILQKAILQFAESLADDLNISLALAALFDLMHGVNTLYDSEKLGPGDAREVIYVLQEFNRVLGIFTFEKEEKKPSLELQKLLEKRNEARANKEWALADTLRDQIYSKGYVIEDTSQGPRLKKA